MNKNSKDEAKHKVQVSKSPEMDPPLKKMPEQGVLPLTVTTELSERTKAEMEAGRKAVAEAEEKAAKLKHNT
jgi:hypothetical protein